MLLLAEVAGLHRVGVALAAPQLDTEPLADLLARALMIRVGVGERMGRDPVAFDLAEDAPSREPRPGIHQHVAHQEDVDRVRRKAAQLPEVVRYLFHARDPIHPPSVRCSVAPP